MSENVQTELINSRPIHGGEARDYRVDLPGLGEVQVTINGGLRVDDAGVIERLAAMVRP